MFFSIFEKPLDAKRRFVVPADYRSASEGSLDGLFLFPSLTAGCIEAGGTRLREQYEAMARDLPFTHKTRIALQHQVFAQGKQLAYDTAGRITLPERMCEKFGLTDAVVVVGMYDRFLIWEPAAYEVWAAEQAVVADEGMQDVAERDLASRLSNPAGGAR